MKKILILILGLLLAGGTVKAVPTLDFSVTQDNWLITYTHVFTDPPENVIQWEAGFDGNMFYQSTNIDLVPNVPIDNFAVGEFYFFTPGDHSYLLEIVTTTDTYRFERAYTIAEPVGPNRLPDGGATAALLALGCIGLVWMRRKH